MKRKVKMTRKCAEPKQDKFYFKHPFGGMTPHPPTDCKAKCILVDDEGNRWCDNYFCATICKPKYCKERNEYSDYLHSKMKATAIVKEE